MTVRKYTSRSQQTTLSSAVTSGATVIPVTNASTLFAGVTLTAGQTFTVVIDPDTALEEIVDVTSASSNNLTVTRAVDMSGASAQDHSSGAVVRHMIIGRDLRESNLHIEATAAYNDGTSVHTLHGLTTSDGVITGTTATQTLTNKTFTTPVINGATLSGTITSTATVTGGTITGATITGLSSAGMVSSSATPKDYVDAILGSAVAAATSAASAAVSATAAATSASSAATSASSAATSASSALTSQTAAATSATSAAASATAAATSATSAAASATAAASSAGTATTQATAAATSATSAAASATAAATSATSAAASATAAATSAASAAASTSAAALSATAAATSATSAAASATNAATSATSAAASATAAATSAASALTSQTAAATSASSAATSATAAATSAADALTSANSAATTYDNFDDRYLGAKSTAPTTDNDGNPLLTGALYFNSVLAAMYVWTGTAWSVMATSGDIESVTAGTGLTGGGASGAVTVALDTSSIYVVPSQTSNSGRALTTDGTTASWSTTINGTAIPSSKTLVTTDTTAYVATAGGSVISANTSATALEIRQTGAGNALLVEDETNPDSTPFVITTTGRVGIGTTNPQGPFEVTGSNSFLNGLRINGGNTADTLYQDTGNIGISAAAGAVNINTSNVARLTVSSTGDTTINSVADATTATAARGGGYMGIPQSVAAGSGAYTIVAADAGEHIYTTTTRTVTIPANASVAFPVGTVISFISGVGATTTIAITSDTMYLAGAGTTGSRTLAAHGMATAVKVASTTWYISGNGLS